MLELKITQLDYELLANQIDDGDLVRFHLDGAGYIHYPNNIELSDELENAIIRFCGEIGPEQYLTIDWWSMECRLSAYVSDTRTKVSHLQVDIQIIENYQKEEDFS